MPQCYHASTLYCSCPLVLPSPHHPNCSWPLTHPTGLQRQAHKRPPSSNRPGSPLIGTTTNLCVHMPAPTTTDHTREKGSKVTPRTTATFLSSSTAGQGWVAKTARGTQGGEIAERELRHGSEGSLVRMGGSAASGRRDGAAQRPSKGAGRGWHGQAPFSPPPPSLSRSRAHACRPRPARECEAAWAGGTAGPAAGLGAASTIPEQVAHSARLHTPVPAQAPSARARPPPTLPSRWAPC